MRLVLVGLLLSMSACNFAVTYLPDGGRARVTCDAKTTISVTVLNNKNEPSVGATVTATNPTSGETKSGKTDARGVFIVKDELGEGAVKVTAELNGLTSQEQNITFICGECGCIGNPDAITLNLK